MIAGFNLVAILNGHTHKHELYPWQPSTGCTYICFDDGSAGKVGDFGILHLTATRKSYAQYQATLDANGNWTGSKWTGTVSMTR